jgi:hypothetical protein
MRMPTGTVYQGSEGAKMSRNYKKELEWQKENTGDSAPLQNDELKEHLKG